MPKLPFPSNKCRHSNNNHDHTKSQGDPAVTPPILCKFWLLNSIRFHRLTIQFPNPSCTEHVLRYTHNCRSSVRYWMASEMCCDWMFSERSRSATGLDTFRMRSYARALKFSSVIAIFSNCWLSSSSLQNSLISFGDIREFV